MSFLRAICKPFPASSFAILLALAAGAGAAPPPGIAVVELFTSEGCSSCPPADDLLGEIAADARRAGRPIFPLAFHVDYWDDLGWKDPFSSAACTRRQRAYASVLGSGGPYTPQMVVNGRAAFVGSRRDAARHAIDDALAHPAICQVRIESAVLAPGGGVSVGFRVQGAGATDLALVAVVEREIVRHIGAGENRGRTLAHQEVVRAFATRALGSGMGGRIELHAPRDLDPRHASVVVFVQRPGTLEITGAARAEL